MYLLLAMQTGLEICWSNMLVSSFHIIGILYNGQKALLILRSSTNSCQNREARTVSITHRLGSKPPLNVTMVINTLNAISESQVPYLKDKAVRPWCQGTKQETHVS